jgi:hypothetical protein
VVNCRFAAVKERSDTEVNRLYWLVAGDRRKIAYLIPTNS